MAECVTCALASFWLTSALRTGPDSSLRSPRALRSLTVRMATENIRMGRKISAPFYHIIKEPLQAAAPAHGVALVHNRRRREWLHRPRWPGARAVARARCPARPSRARQARTPYYRELPAATRRGPSRCAAARLLF